jgi:hypothetical protein
MPCAAACWATTPMARIVTTARIPMTSLWFTFLGPDRGRAHRLSLPPRGQPPLRQFAGPAYLRRCQLSLTPMRPVPERSDVSVGPVTTPDAGPGANSSAPRGSHPSAGFGLVGQRRPANSPYFRHTRSSDRATPHQTKHTDHTHTTSSRRLQPVGAPPHTANVVNVCARSHRQTRRITCWALPDKLWSVLTLERPYVG